MTFNPFSIRTGYGVDIHQLVENRKLIIGGIEVPSSKGALGHSDADVLLHAICDALLGAANLRDIGHHFPDTDSKYKNADSKILLRDTFKLVKEKGYVLGNLDSTVLLETPKLSPHINAMRKVIANILEADEDQVSVKATRGEGLGFIGEGKGIKAYCSVLIHKND